LCRPHRNQAVTVGWLSGVKDDFDWPLSQEDGSIRLFLKDLLLSCYHENCENYIIGCGA